MTREETVNKERVRPSFIKMLRALYEPETDEEELEELLDSVPEKDREALLKSDEYVTKMGEAIRRDMEKTKTPRSKSKMKMYELKEEQTQKTTTKKPTKKKVVEREQEVE